MIDRFDAWLAPNGPVALTIVESYIPVTGKDSVLFPPTFAPEENSESKPSYVIDSNGVCIVDTVASQANRLEPIFEREPYSGLVPQVNVKVGDRTVNLLQAGHRAADAIVRFSSLWPTLRAAFLHYRETGQAHKVAFIAPTSLVFGAWDSRDTQAKLPRLVSSTIRAFGVQQLTRAAQYFSSIEEDTRKATGIDGSSLGDNKFPAENGLVDNPSGRVSGGIIATQGVKREAFLNLVALRSLAASSPEESRNLQRYILGLSLVAFLAPCDLYLRQGCLLCLDPDTKPLKKVVQRNGTQQELDFSEEAALEYAVAARAAFNPSSNQDVTFDPDLVKKALEEKKAKKKKE